jgi:D-alanyl-D-alanine carboxypeptidase
VRIRLALGVLLAAGCGGGHRSETLRASLQPVVAAGVPGALVYVRDGDRTETAAIGLRPDSRFRIGSVTKTFVATVVLQLVAEGKVRLGEPVAGRLRGLLPDGNRITIRDLLAHRSGLVDVADDPQVIDGPRSTWSMRRLVALAARQPRTSRPGGAFRYSSTNYLVLGLYVEQVTGHSIGTELVQRIARPLGLADTAYIPGRIRGPHVHGHSLPSHQGVVDAAADPRDLDVRSATWAGAAGDLVSTPRDVAAFLRGLLGGRLLPPAQLHEMETVRDGYGLGLALHDTPCGDAWGHTGNLNGVLTVALSTRDGRRQVVLVANEYPLTAAADTALHHATTVAFCGGR